MSGNNSVDDTTPVDGETIPPDEAEATQAILRTIEEKVRDAAKIPIARRDAHPKGHGCVMAHFEILPDLPRELQVGLFAEPKSYDAWIRFSNGKPVMQEDGKFDARGMAIKLMGVAESPSTTQDFVLINHNVFAVRNVADYLALETAKPLLRFFFPDFDPSHWRLHELIVTGGILFQWVNNLLNIRYWSMSAYRFGDGACKFSVRPIGPPSHFTSRDRGLSQPNGDPNFLRLNLVRHLAEREAVFEFMVQRRGRPETMPIEDPTIAWNETDAPFVPVARITIPRQTFDSAEQMLFCENLSFNPWHCTPAHRPLGGLNRLRKAVYERISTLRHGLAKQARTEPTDFSIG